MESKMNLDTLVLVHCEFDHHIENDGPLTLAELVHVQELDAAEVIAALETEGKYVFDAGSNGDSDLVTVTLANPQPRDETVEAEIQRILSLSDEEVMAEHLALYEGDQRRADKSIDMMRAGLQSLLAKHWKH
jgi:hypothetical protein